VRVLDTTWNLRLTEEYVFKLMKTKSPSLSVLPIAEKRNTEVI
jgi:hypothetical protein